MCRRRSRRWEVSVSYQKAFYVVTVNNTYCVVRSLSCFHSKLRMIVSIGFDVGIIYQFHVIRSSQNNCAFGTKRHVALVFS